MADELLEMYALMYRSRCFEEAVQVLWSDGLISGEMHMNLGEEAVYAGIVPLLKDGDAMALDHRGTAPLLMRGLDPGDLLREFLGLPGGLCRGRGGHMHLFDPDTLSASSGIVGASGPLGVGFALAAKRLRSGLMAAAFFGEGAVNQGMLMEAMNLAVVWKLPLLFICKDDGYSITADSSSMSGGEIPARAESLGLRCLSVDGLDAGTVRSSAETMMDELRSGAPPGFLHAACVHLEGHFLGFPLKELQRHPLRQMNALSGGIAKAVFARGGIPTRERLAAVTALMSDVFHNLAEGRRSDRDDPLVRGRSELKHPPRKVEETEAVIRAEIARTVTAVLEEAAA